MTKARSAPRGDPGVTTVPVAVGDPILGIGLQTVLDGDESFRAVGVVESAAEVRDAVARLHPDLVLLDVGFGGPTSR